MAPKQSYVYAVAAGRVPGVYHTWAEAKAQVDGYLGARYKKFASHQEAQAFVKGRGSVLLGQLGAIVEEPIASSSSGAASSPHSNDSIVAFTDGSAINNGRKNAKGGYSVVFPNHERCNLSAPLPSFPTPTNNRAEYMALLECLEVVDREIDQGGSRTVIVYTDSKLLLQSVTQWMKGWKKNGWKKADGAAVLNRDLLEAIDAKLQRRRVEMHHVLAHTGREDWKSKWNDMVDRMARAAAQAIPM